MPLKLDLKCGEKMIVNGAVLENVGPNAKVLIHNLATVLREKEILTKEDAVTPAARVYFTLQCAYIFPERRDEHLKHYKKFLKDYVEACPSASDIAEKIRGHTDAGDYYKGMKVARNLIAHEVETMNQFHSGIRKLEEIAAEAGLEADSDNEPALEKEGGTEQ